MSISEMAVVMARYAAASVSSQTRKAAIHTIQDAVRRYPEYMSGIGEPTDLIARATDGRVIMKTGAEGFLCAFIPDQGLGVALKIADGSARARVIAFLNLLGQLDLLTPDALRALTPLLDQPVYNSIGATVGKICGCDP
jgi:L-asparaginase II